LGQRFFSFMGWKQRIGPGFQLPASSGYTCVVTDKQPEPELGTTSAQESGQPSGVNAQTPRQNALRLVVAALMLRGDEVLICQRRPDQPMALQWEFPGGKIEPGEGPEEALARELNEELGIEATIGSKVTHIRHNYRHGGAVDLQFFAVYAFRGEIENRIFKDVRWVKLEDLTNYDFLVADRGLIKDLAAGKLL
jgi:8-oxo-dGTP diphosphatase